MNKQFIIGNLTGDPQQRVTQNGKDVCAFTVAVNRRGQTQEADFFHVTVWDKLAGICGKNLKKGKKVLVIGRTSVSTYQAKDGTIRAVLELTAEEVQFLSPREQPAGQQQGYQEVSSDDLPWG